MAKLTRRKIPGPWAALQAIDRVEDTRGHESVPTTDLSGKAEATGVHENQAFMMWLVSSGTASHALISNCHELKASTKILKPKTKAMHGIFCSPFPSLPGLL